MPSVGIPIDSAQWIKSSRSQSGGNCVEVARNLPDIVAVRDSKNPQGGHLAVSPTAWKAFLSTIA